MCRTWSDYAQASNSMVVLPDGVPPVGLSDSEELKRAGIDVDLMSQLGRIAGVDEHELLSGERTIGTDN